MTRRQMGVSTQAVWAVLADGSSYGDWVVGARMIRAVAPNWPVVGSRLHYTVGYGPLRKDDQTEVMGVAPARRLELRAHAWPAGQARIVLTLRDAGGGTLVTMEEFVEAGPAKRLHTRVADLIIRVRNHEALRRLNRLAREQAQPLSG